MIAFLKIAFYTMVTFTIAFIVDAFFTRNISEYNQNIPLTYALLRARKIIGNLKRETKKLLK